MIAQDCNVGKMLIGYCRKRPDVHAGFTGSIEPICGGCSSRVTARIQAISVCLMLKGKVYSQIEISKSYAVQKSLSTDLNLYLDPWSTFSWVV